MLGKTITERTLGSRKLSAVSYGNAGVLHHVANRFSMLYAKIRMYIMDECMPYALFGMKLLHHRP
jgi:hypothetical protein